MNRIFYLIQTNLNQSLKNIIDLLSCEEARAIQNINLIEKDLTGLIENELELSKEERFTIGSIIKTIENLSTIGKGFNSEALRFSLDNLKDRLQCFDDRKLMKG